jgi:hypothetical protein
VAAEKKHEAPKTWAFARWMLLQPEYPKVFERPNPNILQDKIRSKAVFSDGKGVRQQAGSKYTNLISSNLL